MMPALAKAKETMKRAKMEAINFIFNKKKIFSNWRMIG
jgi:hypothetical protein